MHACIHVRCMYSSDNSGSRDVAVFPLSLGVVHSKLCVLSSFQSALEWVEFSKSRSIVFGQCCGCRKCSAFVSSSSILQKEDISFEAFILCRSERLLRFDSSKLHILLKLPNGSISINFFSSDESGSSEKSERRTLSLPVHSSTTLFFAVLYRQPNVITQASRQAVGFMHIRES